MTRKHKPQYRHDSSRDIFLGNHFIRGEPVDLYLNPDVHGDRNFDRFVVRRGSRASDTLTMLALDIQGLAEVKVGPEALSDETLAAWRTAYRLAKQRGLA